MQCNRESGGDDPKWLHAHFLVLLQAADVVLRILLLFAALNSIGTRSCRDDGMFSLGLADTFLQD